jgi:hypothetical protein
VRTLPTLAALLVGCTSVPARDATSSAPPPSASSGAAGLGSNGARVGAASAKGRLPPPVIQRIVRASFGSFRRCYERGLATDSTLRGSVRVKFVIARSGAVESVLDAGSTLPDSDVVSCVLAGFTTLKFPQPDGGMVTVVYPIQFAPGDP